MQQTIVTIHLPFNGEDRHLIACIDYESRAGHPGPCTTADCIHEAVVAPLTVTRIVAKSGNVCPHSPLGEAVMLHIAAKVEPFAHLPLCRRCRLNKIFDSFPDYTGK